jgi:DEAD/DEAH box helicase domain-containing protein
LAADAIFAAADARQIFQLLLKHFTRAGWLVEKEASGEPLWMLNPNRLLLEKNLSTIACDHCRHSLNTSPELARHFAGMPCLRRHCRGSLQQTVTSAPTRDYGITEPRRLAPHEHTGLLPREEREAVEHSFINGKEPWHINCLSATPTLEMGIDIGELSSVFLCSVPPAQANYLQRIGRAGRRDGNALAVTVANGQNHDLYFYEDPMEMMAGSVHTPGVFLKATAVLERQLTAYCFDRWTATGIDESAIPAQMRKVLDAVEHSRLEQFPHTLLSFISRNRSELLSGFLRLFHDLDENARDHLAQFIHDRGEKTLARRLINRLQELAKERGVILQKIKQLKAGLDGYQTEPDDEATRQKKDELERERNALTSLVYSVNSQPVLNFFTDEGLLPNYAFPEEGVTLRSVILRRKPRQALQDGESAYEKIPYIFQRPAQTALSELAPESRFYAISHEMEIDQIDLQLSESEDWRFCNRCQHTERVDIADQHSACPKCGSPQWADSGQKHRVLKLRQVYSTVDDYKNRIDDSSEQREPTFFNRQMLVSIPSGAGQGGYRLKSETLPFGFEYLQRAILREVNFGPMGGDLHNFSVAGREMPRAGFHVCRHCGQVQKERRNEKPHAYTCKLFKNPGLATPEDFFSSLYLYRELESEAVRILLPLSEVAYSDEKLHSFIAALNLGLREYFHGNVQHLEVTDMREPPSAGSGERIYLVIYDRIPGGTGYLKELMRAPENLFGVLHSAWQKLTTCRCIEDENRDGCYKCILAYRDSRNMPSISRHAAAELLADILAQRDQLESVADLDSISTNVLIESKLEQKFLDALAQLPGARMTPRLIRGKSGALLSLPGEEGKPVSWLVEHQVNLGPEQGVALHTAVDVLLTPAREEDANIYRPIAVYLDGLQYHHDIVADDVCKRSALLLSESYWVYSLNWDDLPQPGKPVSAHERDLMRVDGLMQAAMAKLYEGAANNQQWPSAAEHSATHHLGSLAWLEKLLRNPGNTQSLFPQRALFRALTVTMPTAMQDGALRQKMAYELMENAPAAVREKLNLETDTQVPGGFMDALGNSLGGVEMTVAFPMAAIQTGQLADMLAQSVVHLCFDDRDTTLSQSYKNAWRGFWHAVNQLQFLPGFSMATRQAIASDQMEQMYAALHALKGAATAASASQPAEKWKNVFALSVIDIQWLRDLAAMDIPEPEVGLDLTDADGEVVYSGDLVELCWPQVKVAVINGPITIELEGWQMVEADDRMVNTIKELIESGVFA